MTAKLIVHGAAVPAPPPRARGHGAGRSVIEVIGRFQRGGRHLAFA